MTFEITDGADQERYVTVEFTTSTLDPSWDGALEVWDHVTTDVVCVRTTSEGTAIITDDCPDWVREAIEADDDHTCANVERFIARYRGLDDYVKVYEA